MADAAQLSIEADLQMLQALYAQSLALAAVEIYPHHPEWFAHQLMALGEDVFRRIRRLNEERG
jgi:hypothetical protein